MAEYRQVSAAVLLTLALACGPAENAALSHPDAAFEQWTLGQPTALIGGSTGAGGAQLTEVRHLLPIGEGSVVLLDSRIVVLMLYDTAGRLIRNIGRQGQGPGEYRYVSSIGRLNDSLWAAESNSRRLSFFGLDGEFRSSRPLASASVRTGPTRTSRFLASGLLSNGRLAGFVGLPHDHPDRPVPPPHGNSGMLALFDADSVVRDTLMWLVQASPSLMLDVPPNLHFPGPNYFADTPLWHIAGDGSGVVVVERPPAPSGEPASYRVIRWNGDGERVFNVDIPYAPVPVPEMLVDTAVNFLADDMKEFYPSLDAVRQMVRDTLRVPRFFPPASRVLVGTDGSIWVAREGVDMAGYEARRYDVLDTAGRPAGIVSLDRPAKILAATSQAVWVVETDEDDVPTVIRYPLVKRANPAGADSK